MYEIAYGELLKAQFIQTSVQEAIIRTHVAWVHGYDADDPITFETIPERPAGNYELHYKDGSLIWKPVTT